ncbi:Ribonuclease H-like domain [Pseudocohnilembus persalinus]|uniref:Ribonuclease H-like domain n=1 Tax=Pseudocohnilembus persalinus TaxID=266149 RepID=A0A0V0R633_PSEPJ|nr:Ribonuclease H-like domain [Pseudocohnilembus persalinus]|eukprot:KRX09932.1 Ribonuclease H-like domain [Pseudocohnilembus persalinus]
MEHEIWLKAPQEFKMKMQHLETIFMDFSQIHRIYLINLKNVFLRQYPDLVYSQFERYQQKFMLKSQTMKQLFNNQNQNKKKREISQYFDKQYSYQQNLFIKNKHIFGPGEEVVEFSPKGTYYNLVNDARIEEKNVYFIDRIQDEDFQYAEKVLKGSQLLGFDSEGQMNGLSLIQISTDKEVFIFDVYKIQNLQEIEYKQFQQLMEFLIESENIKIVGQDIHGDFQHLEREIQLSKNLEFKEIIDLKQAFLYCYENETKSSLAHITKILLGKNLSKIEQCSGWYNRPLRKSQIHYAALDAFICLKLWQEIQMKFPDLRRNYTSSKIECKYGDDCKFMPKCKFVHYSQTNDNQQTTKNVKQNDKNQQSSNQQQSLNDRNQQIKEKNQQKKIIEFKKVEDGVYEAYLPDKCIYNEQCFNLMGLCKYFHERTYVLKEEELGRLSKQKNFKQKQNNDNDKDEKKHKNEVDQQNDINQQQNGECKKEKDDKDKDLEEQKEEDEENELEQQIENELEEQDEESEEEEGEEEEEEEKDEENCNINQRGQQQQIESTIQKYQLKEMNLQDLEQSQQKQNDNNDEDKQQKEQQKEQVQKENQQEKEKKDIMDFRKMIIEVQKKERMRKINIVQEIKEKQQTSKDIQNVFIDQWYMISHDIWILLADGLKFNELSLPEKFNYENNQFLENQNLYGPGEEVTGFAVQGSYFSLEEDAGILEKDIYFINECISEQFQHANKVLRESNLLGFDTESCVGFESGLALIQISSEKEVFIFDVIAILKKNEKEKRRFRDLIQFLFEEEKVLIDFKGVVDISDVYFQCFVNEKKHGLAYICEKFLDKKLSKIEQCSGWHQRPLRKSQIHYSALDAYICLRLWKEANKQYPNLDFTDHIRDFVKNKQIQKLQKQKKNKKSQKPQLQNVNEKKKSDDLTYQQNENERENQNDKE